MTRPNHNNTIKGEASRQRIIGVLSVEPATATRIGHVLLMGYPMAYSHLMRMHELRQAYIFGYKRVHGKWRAIWAAGNRPDAQHPDADQTPAQVAAVPVFLEYDDKAEKDAKARAMVEAATSRQNTWLGALG